MARKLTAKKIQQMWEAFLEKQTDHYVVTKCHVSRTTVRRYRAKQNWDERLAAIEKAANDKADETVAAMLARHAERARGIQIKAIEKVLRDGFRTGKDAADTYFKATAEERVARGEPGERVEVIEDLRKRYARRHEKRAK